jgi:hypothetical protein
VNAGQISVAISEVQAVGDTILTTLEAVDPGVALPAATAEIILDLVAKYAVKALTAWSTASGTPITVESIQALLPNPEALSLPDATGA